MGHTRARRILELIGDTPGLKVLDVACSRGYLGQRIKEKGNHVSGIEISGSAAREAEKVLDKVHVFDIEQPWPDHLRQEQFDVVVLAEILEHVFDPVEVLKEVNTALKPGGVIVITTPNFMTWTNRLRFLFGNFKYQEQGMFDFGHIRWFTYYYLHQILLQSGFEITDERHIIFPGKLSFILKYWPSVFAFQFIVKVRKE
jgi:2-polyprenyl-3-methyl-5-hydroxy-6-metoxy-1,4-benzoquinol methylase